MIVEIETVTNHSLAHCRHGLMKQCVACCRETKEGLNRVGKGYDKLSNLLRELGKFEVLERCVARLQDDDHDVWLHASCRTELWNAHKSLQRAGIFIFRYT